MIILDNIIFSLQRAGGISTVWEQLINGIYNKMPLTLLEYQDALENLHRRNLKIDNSYIEKCKTKSLLWEQFISPKISFKEPFIFHSSFYRICNNKKATNITTVHDFIYELAYPTRSIKQRIRCGINHNAIRKSDVIVCISDNTKKDLLRLLPDVKDRQIHVIYNGVSEDYFRLPEIDNRYRDSLLFVGGRQGYKNFDFAVEMAAISNLKLIVCGNELSEKEKLLLDTKLGSSGYDFILRPSNKSLNLIYNSVKALIYPSSYEGFGIPILEAQRAGCPVIALNTSSIPEVIGETPLMLQSLDERSFKKSLKLLEANSEVKNIIEAGLKNSKRFSWAKMADEYLDLYKSLT